jgi:hypothetical protein
VYWSLSELLYDQSTFGGQQWRPNGAAQAEQNAA